MKYNSLYGSSVFILIWTKGDDATKAHQEVRFVSKLGTQDINFEKDFWITRVTHVDWLSTLTNQEKAGLHCVFFNFYVVYNTCQVITQSLHSQNYNVLAMKCLSSRTQHVIFFFSHEVNTTSFYRNMKKIQKVRLGNRVRFRVFSSRSDPLARGN